MMRRPGLSAAMIFSVVVALGILVGGPVSSAWAEAPEAPVARPATAVTGDSALLHGELNPGKAGQAGEYQFVYKVSEAACRPEAEFIPEPPAPSFGAAKEAVSIEAVDLEPNQTYAFCVLALNAGEEAQSPALTFKTLETSEPYVIAGSTVATGVTPFAATLAAKINPEEGETEYSFEYASNPAFTGANTISGGSPLPAEFNATGQEVSVQTGTELSPLTTYYYRVIAKNPTGTSEGPVEQFTTLEPKPPAIESESVSALHSAEPKLEAQVNPEYQETSYFFEYSDHATGEVLEAPITTLAGAPPAPLLPAVSEARQAGPVALHKLVPGPTYYYRVVATNASGTTEGPVHSFVALAAPGVEAIVSGEATRTTMVVRGSINPDGLPTTYHFSYVPQSSYEAGGEDPYVKGRSTYEQAVDGQFGESLTDYSAHSVEAMLEELAPGTTYHYALVATNELGSTSGSDGTFTTSAATPPSVTTGSVEGVSETSSTLTGTVETAGLQTTSQFEVGTSPGSGTVLQATIISSSGAQLSISATFHEDLLPGTTYYYRAVASSQDGVSYGSIRSFTTSSFPPVLTLPQVPALIPYLSIRQLNVEEALEAPKNPKSLTRPERLAKALQVCHRRPKKQRAACIRKARRRYGAQKAPARR